MAAAFSFRTRILALVLAVGLVPLGLLGLWLTGATARSGQELLQERLVEALDQAALRLGNAWISHRSELLDVAEMEAVRTELRGAGSGAVAAASPAGAEPEPVRDWMEARPGLVRRLTLRDGSGSALWTTRAGADPEGFDPSALPALDVELPVHDGPVGPRIGTLEVELAAPALLGSVAPTVAGMVLGAFGPEDLSLLPLPLDPELLLEERFRLAGDEWLSVRRELREPRLVLVAAAPLTPFIRPFEESARRGSYLMLAVLLAGLALAWLLSRRLTGSLEELAAAADGVARGELTRTVPEEGSDEVARVASAFNAMIESLRRTLAELADRRALAAVGEFAASLAHEIRNPLTAIRVDLQMVEERLPEADPGLREIQARALAEIQRLDGTVAGALQAARSGRVQARAVDVLEPLRAAARAAGPALEEAGARLKLPPENVGPVPVRGDPEALEQLFLNLLLNAAQALEDGGTVRAAVEEDEDGRVVVAVEDDGRGIPEEELERVFEPFHTTRPGGTGLGLAIARRLARAHGGEIEVKSEAGRGTTVRVRLPGVGA